MRVKSTSKQTARVAMSHRRRAKAIPDERDQVADDDLTNGIGHTKSDVARRGEGQGVEHEARERREAAKNADEHEYPDDRCNLETARRDQTGEQADREAPDDVHRE